MKEIDNTRGNVSCYYMWIVKYILSKCDIPSLFGQNAVHLYSKHCTVWRKKAVLIAQKLKHLHLVCFMKPEVIPWFREWVNQELSPNLYHAIHRSLYIFSHVYLLQELSESYCGF